MLTQTSSQSDCLMRAPALWPYTPQSAIQHPGWLGYDVELQNPEGLEQVPVSQSWMELLGAAFQDITHLQVWADTDRTAHLPTPFFAGPSVCHKLQHLCLLKSDGQWQQWELRPQLAANPQLLRQWLPNVRELVCTADTADSTQPQHVN